MFALLIFENLPSNLEDAVFEKLAKQASLYKNSTCYLVDFTIEKSVCKKWIIAAEESTVSHKKVFKISADNFYSLVTQNEDAFHRLNRVC